MDYDLVVRGGTIVDGSGGETFIGDIAICGTRIVVVGDVKGRGREEIDATGKIVTPGFVDVHTHYDGQVTWERSMAPSSDHGVTTVVMGNCGVGFAPVRPGDHGLMIKLMEGVEDIPEVVLAEGVPFNWESFPDYLEALEQRESDVDFATQLPHSPLRVFVMGERGANLEPPTEADLAAMRAIVKEAVEAGALGVSTSRNLFHRFRSGALAPSVKTEEDELLALAAGLRDAGAGVFQCNPNLDNDAASELRMLEKVARASGRPVNFSLIAGGDHQNWKRYVAGVRDATARGLDIRAQFLPRPIGVLYGLDISFHTFSLNPSYKAIAHLPLAGKVAKMRDSEFRRQLLSEAADDPNPAFVGMVTLSGDIYPLGEPASYDFAPHDSLRARAERLGRPYREVIYDALLEDEGRAILCVFSTSVADYLDNAAPLIGKENMIVALGDGGAHYGMVCDAAYTTYILTDRLGKNGLTLSTAIEALTHRPAASLGLQDRGLLRAGYKADINVIALEALVLHRPTVIANLPAGGKRLVQKADGYEATIVSGIITRRQGVSTGAFPGRLVRGEGPKSLSAAAE